MTEKQLWAEFSKFNPEAEEYDAWCFGSEAADCLAQLTAQGIKTATASAYPLYELEGEPLPRPGQYSVVLYRSGAAACVIRTTRVYVASFRDVSAEHAWREGEGDRSLEYWRRVHRDFFTQELRQAGLSFTEEMAVVCEEFEVVHLPQLQ